MGTCIKKDLFKYKQHPYFEKPNKKERISISRAFRHLAKIQIEKGENIKFLNLDEFIKKLLDLQKHGCGDKELIFDDCYYVSDVSYDADSDRISII